ncbi:acyl-CoA thioester hydrolase [Pseudomonas sp. PA15(2017)]|uniref:acyl-CoA thioester hydrolase/BAAT C-terminal domain-containing protein n=1 Tax=Pseudomonas sp. PA15(2017) TaxID=1932111 RepID=UPI00095FEE27|nr:acyl-CoA thioester hydrolase/BAAT C-terminal domain-containing protein [Pseudomonas sp. PA15(2017)]OLU28175.1 acyl-CoA thioester hydrolase [Pseudomonas sp. PA15(2017)]
MSPAFEIDIADGLIDQPRRICVGGLNPGLARLTTTLEHPDGSLWQSEARFDIGADGALDIDAQLPFDGDWSELEALAPVWSLRQLSPPHRPQASEGLEPLSIRLQVRDAAGASASATLTQRFLAPGVSRREIREEGLSATLFSPEAAGPHPLVIVLNGSGGGTPEQRAALYAAQGYAALALAYFKAPGLPEHISDTPLEYFEQALNWAARTLQPRHGFIAVAGLSRGGELALLLGATFPERVSAVIGYVPSAVIHGTLRAGRPEQARDADAWTWRGQPLRNVWRDNPAADWRAFDQPPEPGAAILQAPAFVAVEAHAASVEAARIPVERIKGPVLLISGSDDGFWPSSAYSERIQAELQAAGHAWPVTHVRGEGAGHAIGFPFVPTTQIARVHPVAGVLISGGGTPFANARANRESWHVVLAFLADARRTREAQS